MEIAPGIHRIETPLGDRFVCLYLLVGSEHALLLDTGVDSTPAEYLAPYLDQIGQPAWRQRDPPCPRGDPELMGFRN